MNNGVIEILIDLAQLDIDAVEAYHQALERIDNKPIFDEINKFKNDHVRHIEELSALITKFGGAPPEKSKDIKGYLIEGFTALRSITGTEGALNAMETNEKVTNAKYKEAIEKNLNYPAEIMEVLQRNYSDERHHLSYIQDQLEKIEAE